ncbi:PhoP regulatory network protein YrbL [Aurantivibrio infirmus]
MLQLNSSHYVGKGLHRVCYVHPDQPRLCVKVVVNGNNQETKREYDYYQHLQKRNIDWTMLPQFYGETPTDQGNAGVFDLIRDYNGEVSKTLASYLSSNDISEQEASAICEAFMTLKSYLLDNRIVTMTIKPKNILFQKSSATSGKLVIVDNIGNSDFIPIANYLTFFAHRKIMRKWRHFETNILSAYKDSLISQKIALSR